MESEQTKPVLTVKDGQRRQRRKKGDDHRADLHARLDRFLDNATNPATLDSLVSGLVDYELGVRLAAISNGVEGGDPRRDGNG